MAYELRNFSYIVSMVFNESLMFEFVYARVFFCALVGQLGIIRLIDIVFGITFDVG